MPPPFRNRKKRLFCRVPHQRRPTRNHRPGMKNKIVREVINGFLIVLGILSAGMGLKGFLLSSRFIDGGVTGISMLAANVLDVPLFVLVLVFNIPFVILGYRQIGGKFAVKSILAIAGLSFMPGFCGISRCNARLAADRRVRWLFHRGGHWLGHAGPCWTARRWPHCSSAAKTPPSGLAMWY